VAGSVARAAARAAEALARRYVTTAAREADAAAYAAHVRARTDAGGSVL
jgi:hypothetical protein